MVSKITTGFLVGFETLLIESQECSGKKPYLGDFNVWMGKQNSVATNKFRNIPNNFGMILLLIVLKFYSWMCKC